MAIEPKLTMWHWFRMRDRKCDVCGASTCDGFLSRDLRVCENCLPAYKAVYLEEAPCPWCQKPALKRKDSDAPYCCTECLPNVKECTSCHEDFWKTKQRRGADRRLLDMCIDCRAKELANQFWLSVPSLYQSTKLERLPCPDATSRFISQLKDSGPLTLGFYLWGETGTGKTRSMYLGMFETAKLWSFSDMTVVRGQEFAKEIIERTRPDGSGDLDDYLRKLRNCDVLGIDEVDKIRLSERVESEFFDLFETRQSNQMLTVFTSNMSAPEFSQRFSPNCSGPVARRLAEFFNPIQFKHI